VVDGASLLWKAEPKRQLPSSPVLKVVPNGMTTSLIGLKVV
jgi:hypothetical protein